MGTARMVTEDEIYALGRRERRMAVGWRKRCVLLDGLQPDGEGAFFAIATDL